MVKIINILEKELNNKKKQTELMDSILNGNNVACAVYMPKCHYCEKLQPEWEQLANKSFSNGGNNLTISYIHMNIPKEIESLSYNKVRFGEIGGFPHIVMFKNGVIEKEYKGQHNAISLEEWINSNIKSNLSISGGSKRITRKKRFGGKKTKKNKKIINTIDKLSSMNISNITSNSSFSEFKIKIKKTRKEKDPFKDTHLYPEIVPFKKALLKVSDHHKIAFYLFGNSKGKPVLFVHGGPGAGTTYHDARFFDPKKYLIILFDQRGCGNSTPFGSLKENTTPHLVGDMEKLRKHLNIKKWMLFGGSWGSTLSLTYAIKHPEYVAQLILRGIFLHQKYEIDWVNNGKGANFIYPEMWDEYKSVVRNSKEKNYLKSYGKLFKGKKGDSAKHDAFMKWSLWESSISKLLPMDKAELEKELKKENQYITMSKIEHHYFSNGGFFPRNGYLLEKKNIDRIKNIPTVIVQGRYDIVCPSITAYSLHKKLPKSKYYTTIAGHSSFEPETIKKLVQSTNYYKK